MTLIQSQNNTGNADTVRILCEHGAEVNAKSPNGQTPLRYAAQKGNFGESRTQNPNLKKKVLKLIQLPICRTH